MDEERRSLLSIRRWVVVFIAGLVLSGVTAFPLVHELHWLVRFVGLFHSVALQGWVERVNAALDWQAAHAPFLAYGTDWLAFGHLVIATAFLGLWSDPVRTGGW